MSLRVSVLISTHNPDLTLFGRTLRAIAAQTLDAKNWELIIVDNASAKPLEIDDISYYCRNFRMVREERLGLTYGRLAGIRESVGSILVFVDDDNVLAPNYLENAIRIFECNESLGVAGGIIEPEWRDQEPESWVSEFMCLLALRNFGCHDLISTDILHPNSFPVFSPIGAGMVARRAALTIWMAQADYSTITGRRGDELKSGDDSDMVLNARRSGWSVGYFPELKLTHLIPARRLSVEYLARLNYASAKSEVELLHKHGICPWPPALPWTVSLRKVRSYLRCRAWAGPAQYLRWQNACGRFDGRASIYAKSKFNN